MPKVILHQFPSSHYNEKARWALTYKGIEHARQGYLPGPHISQIKKLSGQSSVPVLEWDGEIVPGSDAIIEYAESKVPARPLFPADPVQKQQVIDWCRRLDKELGPAVRTIAWAGMINHNRYATSVFGKGKPSVTMFFYRLAFPLLKPLIAKANGVNPENIEKSKKVVQSYLDEIGEVVLNTGYLVGEQFSAADLTAAALLAPLANPDHEDMQRPTPIVASFREILDTYSPHPTIAWVEKQYRDQRG
jgi:glutathione S-transferase